MNTKFKFFIIVALLAALLLFVSCSKYGSRTHGGEDASSTGQGNISYNENTTALHNSDSASNNVNSDTESAAYTKPSSTVHQQSTTNPASVRAFFYRLFRVDENEATQPTASTSAAKKAEVSFENTAFIGNSRVDSFRGYGLLTEADYFTKVGLSITNVYSDTVSGGQTALEGIKNAQYDRVILVFGDNECGWPYTDVFIEKYNDFIDEVAAIQPNAKIYLQSVLPISKAASDKNQDYMNMDNINALNFKIKKLASDKGIGYFDTPPGLIDGNGFLLDVAATDGIHFGKEYCEIWIDYMKQHLEG